MEKTKRRTLQVFDRLINRYMQTRLQIAQAERPQDLLSRLLKLNRDDPAA